MNEHSPDRAHPGSRPRPTTQAAEGVPRLQWTLEEFERLTELGIFAEEDRIELIGGELVPMSPKGRRHEAARDELLNWLMRRLPADVRLSSEIGWRPNAQSYFEPDLIVYPAGMSGVTVAPDQVLLLLEVAASSLKFDTIAKASQYAALGVREYWVVNAVTLETRVHLRPGEASYQHVAIIGADAAATPHLLQSCAVRLGDLAIPSA